MTYLLQVLQKTAPPVLVFAENKRDVDEVQEYLLLKGVSAVSVHGGKSQEERNESIDTFKAGKADVLVATDVAAKGLDFPAIQHVINFDMPKEIENYVHRIGEFHWSDAVHRTRRRLVSCGGVFSTLQNNGDVNGLTQQLGIFLLNSASAASLACSPLHLLATPSFPFPFLQVVPVARARRAWRPPSSTSPWMNTCCWT